MSMLVRTKQRLTSALDDRIFGSCCMRMCVGTESHRRCHYNIGIVAHSRPIKTLYQQRFLSSARPISDDEHEEVVWTYNEATQIGQAKRAPPYSNMEQTPLTLPTSSKMNDDSTAVINWTEAEDTSNAIAINTSIGKVSSENIISAFPSLNPKETKSEALSASRPERVEYMSPSTLRYTGDAVIPITSILHIVKPKEDAPRGIWPVFRLLNENGEFRNPMYDGFENHEFGSDHVDNIDHASHNDSDRNDALLHLRSKLSNLFPYQSREIISSGLFHSAEHPYQDTNSTNILLLRAHRHLIRLRTMDSILQNAQRQGRISFYMTCTGEEAIHIGAASALDTHDPIFAQYREQGLLMWRGFTLEQFTNQCFSNDRDLGKGRQMPIHYGSRALNYHTVSSPLGTQLPQAVGAAYRLKLLKKPNVAICFFGDGCASTTDFHAAMNFAATLSAPVLFFCRNNGYAISTPVSDQYAGDGIVSRATGYGMAGIRVDGNDIFAVHAAVRAAKIYALKHNAPVLIEGMTYRLGHHSTSDDSTRYRSVDEVEEFADNMDPLVRLNLFLQHNELITEDEIDKIKDEERSAVLDAIKLAEKRPKPSIDSMFTDVYKEVPLHLKKQLEELKNHVAKYPDKY